MFQIQNLHAKRDSKKILNGVDLDINEAEIHVLMGPNGSGKSTLAYTLAGHPSIEVTGGDILLDNKNILDLEPNERLLSGLFVAFQYPTEIPGVSYLEFLRLAYNNIQKFRQGENYQPISPRKFKKLVEEKMMELNMGVEFLDRNLNEGFSGGEKKKSEILQMAVLEPKYAILDETDSGLDISALKIVAENAKKLADKNNIGLLIITHYSRILRYIPPDYVHIFVKGKIVKSGDKELAQKLDEAGYDQVLDQPQEV